MQKIEEIALSKLILDENYCKSVLPFIKEEYFEQSELRTLFGEVNNYVTQYNTMPEPLALKIEVEKRRDLSAELINEIEKFLDERIDNQHYNEKYLKVHFSYGSMY